MAAFSGSPDATDLNKLDRQGWFPDAAASHHNQPVLLLHRSVLPASHRGHFAALAAAAAETPVSSKHPLFFLWTEEALQRRHRSAEWCQKKKNTRRCRPLWCTVKQRRVAELRAAVHTAGRVSARVTLRRSRRGVTVGAMSPASTAVWR